MHRDYKKLACPLGSDFIGKAMGAMTMKNRESGSTDGRGKHKKILGRWFK